jgi:hypothetical protein
VNPVTNTIKAHQSHGVVGLALQRTSVHKTFPMIHQSSNQPMKPTRPVPKKRAAKMNETVSGHSPCQCEPGKKPK